jgi:hypothetical protein
VSAFGIVLIILGAALGWGAVWAGVVSLIGVAAWRPVADRYPAERWPAKGEGIALSWQSGTVGLSNYGAVLDAVLTEGGLYLRPAKIFGFQHPPMFIPWAEMGRGEPAFLGGVKLHLTGGGTITLRGRLGKLVGEALAAAHAGAAEGATDTEAIDGVGEERTERRAGLRVR